MTTIEKLAAKVGAKVEDFAVPEVSKAEKMEAQALYTALMTDTILED